MAAGKVDVSRRVGVSTLSKRFCDPIVEESLIERKFRIRDGFGQDGYVVGTEKPEEGELLDERGTWYVNDEDNVARPQKRRKFSPILWDREDKSPSMQKELSGYVLGFAAGRADTWPNGSKPEVDDSPGYVHSSLTQQTYSDDDREPGRMIEEDFSLVPNISTSRWAYDDELDKDGCNEENDNMSREKVLKSGSPGSGVTQRGNSGGSLYGSSGSDVGCYPLFEGGEHGSGSELDNDGRMEVDERSDDSVADPSDLDSDDDSEPVLPKPSGRNMLLACRSVFEYEKLGKISEGSYGIVYKARDKKTGEMVALKKLKMGREREGFPLYYLREINALLSFNHPSVVNVREVVADDSFDGFDSIYIVMEYVDNDLKSLMQARRQPFSPNEVKCLLLQLLDGVKYLHDNWLLHRDLKTSNLLLNNKGELKICDFGMARQYGSPLNQFTQLVVTLWYRAPELLLGTKEYSTAVDMWSVGCIMAELLTNKPLFDGKTEVDQLDKIFKTLGTPNEKIWPGYSQLPGLKVNFSQQPYNTLRSKFPRTSFMASPVLSDLGFDLLSKLLTYDPAKRITAEDALNHPWFREVPLPSSKDFMPTFPPQYSQMR